jgi:hypothetical protein
MKTVLCFVVLAALAFAAAADVNVSGKWTGSFNINGPDGSSNPGQAVVNLKQTGTELSGTAGPSDGEQFPITKGEVSGEKVTFQVQRGENQIIRFALVLEGDRMKGEANLSNNGETGSAKVDISRVK